GKMNSHAQLCSNGGLNDSQYFSVATHAHAFSERDFRRHVQRELNFFPWAKGGIRKEKAAARAEVLSENGGLVLRPSELHGNRNVEIKSLADATFNSDGFGSHGSPR